MEKYTNFELEVTGINAAVKFLERRGLEVLDTGLEHSMGYVDIAAKEDDTLALVKVFVSHEDMPKEDWPELARASFEKAASDYLKNSSLIDKQIRFDTISIHIMSENQAFLRHHINACCFEDQAEAVA